MDHFSPRDLEYVIRLDEVVWGGALLAVTIVVHGVGMLLTLRRIPLAGATQICPLGPAAQQ